MGALKDTAEAIAPLIRLLASDKPGEVCAAAAGIIRKLQAAGYDLNDLADDLVAAAAERAAPRRASHRTARRAAPRRQPANDAPDAAYWADVVGALWSRGRYALAERDLEFLTNVWARAQQGAAPTHPQRKWISDIQAKLDRTEARAS